VASAQLQMWVVATMWQKPGQQRLAASWRLWGSEGAGSEGRTCHLLGHPCARAAEAAEAPGVVRLLSGAKAGSAWSSSAGPEGTMAEAGP
jgi:hypothetical protein